ncbi:MAG TPA: hypothetical protein VIA18_01495 [Polyangia bacterium]|jgi:molybdopterin/thiamine biosynthesis adenylyltransferase|nr:hypothetical protein [Polyangia bacterium]
MARFSDEEMRRYSRQIVLPEVGGVGQEQLRATTAAATSETAALYLAAAGVGTIRVPRAAWADAARALNPLVTVLVDESVATEAEDVEFGALSAWRAIKGALAP